MGELLKQKGALVIDADAVAHEVVEPGRPALEEIRRHFGDGVMTPEGALNRAELGRRIFADDDARRALNAIMHPRIFEEIRSRVEGQKPDGVVVYEAALLAETYEESLEWLEIDAVVVVDCPVEQQIERLIAQRGITRREAELRVAAQAGRADRLARASYVIDNSGDLGDLRRQVDKMWTRLQRDPDRPLL